MLGNAIKREVSTSSFSQKFLLSKRQAMVSAYNDSPPQNPALYCHVSMQLLMSENRKTIIYCYFRRAASDKLDELLHDWGRKHSANTFERPNEKSVNGLCV